jgi:hypothetical protein
VGLRVARQAIDRPGRERSGAVRRVSPAWGNSVKACHGRVPRFSRRTDTLRHGAIMLNTIGKRKLIDLINSVALSYEGFYYEGFYYKAAFVPPRKIDRVI